MKSPAHHQSNTARGGAFTLIEMVMAMGIVGFAFMTMVGMLPIGMQIFHRAMDLTAKPQMVQHIMGEIDQVPFASLSTMQGLTYYFDDAGNAVAADDSRAMYAAKLDLQTTTTLPGGTQSPNGSLATLTISFTRCQGGNASAKPITFVSYLSDRYRPVSTP